MQIWRRVLWVVRMVDFATQIAAGNDALRLMNDPTLKAAVELVEKQLFDEWKTAKFEADQKYIHATMRGMHEFLRSLQSVIDSGKVAAAIAERRF